MSLWCMISGVERALRNFDVRMSHGELWRADAVRPGFGRS